MKKRVKAKKRRGGTEEETMKRHKEEMMRRKRRAFELQEPEEYKAQAPAGRWQRLFPSFVLVCRWSCSNIFQS